MKIDISKLNKAVILASLYNHAKPQGTEAAQHTADMSKVQAEAIIAGQKETYFEFLNGRGLKVDLVGPEMDTERYDQDNGPGAAFAALRHLLPQP